MKLLERLKLYVLNLHFYSLFVLVSCTVIPALTLFVVCSRIFLSHRQTMKRFRRGISWYGKVIMAVPFPYIRVKYEGGSDVDPDKPFIFVCNHRSATDPFIVGILPHEVAQIVNVWPFRLPVFGAYARWAGYLNIRMMTHEQFIKRALQFLQEGISIVFFPEGTRSTTGKMGAFHGAAFRLACASRVPVVPLCISGSEKIMPKGSSLLRPGRIRVRRLPEITWNEYNILTAFAFKNRVWNIMDRELARMENKA